MVAMHGIIGKLKELQPLSKQNLTHSNFFISRVCVGIQVPPDQDQDWYCRVCISKKQEGDKKKKRKKKDKKEH